MNTETSHTDATKPSIVKPYALGHGTLECRNLNESRRFYEEFLGLECVRHAMPAMAIRFGHNKFHIFCVEVGDDLHPTNLLNHWGIDVSSREEVDAAHDAAKSQQSDYGIRQVTDVVLQHGVYSFYIEDLDHNWWEIQHYDGFQHDDVFDFGDRF
ncbi:catechol 2,3-dioxygenase-like lactoylglutathione lyase family enzyme [Paraburkholderia bannensis]|uniref:Catechol 2,3-dioxygenase-like lactoylglutathione lyase family enzyme n=1 Tax=Paraburkholderia bannensis TaxID=765414 RepID=A0A7W9U1Y8_9BURK|nr:MULTISPECIES: VOC family protein [Paraburkholderia]MBB3259864.1 catechol 2,3-dioxygenase-like lactoylglutathione lyase family enzyme [Paraburkholderia sp. WP4_3_2]MBB6104826.1 catechol 2,3-dioxygenase-like lactoylglutathione lyase family enzyme [Paraburkholderia bannensis]